ncbi:penicillin acylase family protein [Allokutzneria albata]|uniref:Acyl-homoserine-lactone acylase n=1 Tax=Allokutzneria albata TaxID=211114 RepID=A0A1H0BL15_ALLAB|nr:penicillin acylase family protein [Allokutzneria albata]SDN46356.1 acyl-homoserine-lactone acylase [Allokutzneria albata]
MNTLHWLLAPTVAMTSAVAPPVEHETGQGVPHIVASDHAGLGRGIGYAQARDHLCALGQIFLSAGGELAKHFGEERTAGTPPQGNVASDVYTRDLIDRRVVERIVAQPAPVGPSDDVRALTRGYAEGYNRYLTEDLLAGSSISTVNSSAAPSCRGAKWLAPITEMDVHRLKYVSAQDGAVRALGGIVTATPPSRPQAPPTPYTPPISRGSNAIAAGKVFLGNPHVPWRGIASFWQARLTIPGKLDVDGAHLLGTPETVAGYTRRTAWTATIATSLSYSLAEVKLVPGDPTAYTVDGRVERMTEHKITVDVRGGKPETRSLWSTRFGPVINSMVVSPWLGNRASERLDWTAERAFVLIDANANSLRGPNSIVKFPEADSVEGVRNALLREGGMSYANVLASDRHGEGLFANVQAVPHITDAHARRCNTAKGRELFDRAGLPVLDGSRADCAPGTDRDSLVPGTFGAHRMPNLISRDQLSNSNDSHWLTSAAQPLTGFPRVFGTEGTARSPRTRFGLQERITSLRDAQEMVLSNRSFMGELAGDDVLRMCKSMPQHKNACDALAKWDRRNDLDSRGALLFDKFWQQIGDIPWLVPFNPADPVRTPRSLDIDDPRVRAAFTKAVNELGHAPDAPLRDHQFALDGRGKRIPVHGGANALGVYNLIETSQGRAVGGTSFLFAVRFTGNACPEARTILANSQSSDPASPHFADQTELFAAKRWLPGRLCRG